MGDPTNSSRVKCFEQLLGHYMAIKDGRPAEDAHRLSEQEAEEYITDLAADMHHWHHAQYGIPAPDVRPTALMHYEAEIEDTEIPP